MVNVNFNLKNVKRKNETPINMIIRWNNRKLTYSTGEKVNYKDFETQKGKKYFQRVKSTYVGFAEFNARLDYFEATAKTVFRQYVNDNNRLPEPIELKSALNVKLRQGLIEKKNGLLSFVRQFINDVEGSKLNQSTGKIISPGTIRIYKNTLKRLEEYESHYRTKLIFEDINIKFYENYVKYLSQELKLAYNTVGRYIKTLKYFLNEATDRGLNKNLFFKNKRFKIFTESVHKIYLNESEILELFNLDLSNNKRLEKAKDLFIVACWTGLRYGDLVNITPECIKDDFIHIKTQKTGEVVVLPIHWMVRKIMQKYTHRPNSLPPPLSNVKLNKYIKEVGSKIESLKVKVQVNQTRGGELITKVVEKWECITCHSARRSFSTNLYMQGFSSLTIMKSTGHKSERVFREYLRASAGENANLIKNQWAKHDPFLINRDDNNFGV